MNDENEINKAKRKVRRLISLKLKQLTPEEIQSQSQLVQEKLYNLEEFRQSKRIGIFLSMPNEIDTIPILRKCFEDKKQCFVPRFDLKNPLMDMIECYSFEDYLSLPIEPLYKIKQPSMDDADHRERLNVFNTDGLDLLLVPGVAFTKTGLRLGHGKGYYDRWLAKCLKLANTETLLLHTHDGYSDDDNVDVVSDNNKFTNTPSSFRMPYTIGLGLREQIIDEIPIGKFDIKIDRILSP
ncbi:5-formyltetrahydrofolate cyclo-ligase-like protein [Sarcoptes scabiei]|nr:5-formyltetrahydrofolate cyclo-ligase-like protein [Sarcoptes scabiei]